MLKTNNMLLIVDNRRAMVAAGASAPSFGTIKQNKDQAQELAPDQAQAQDEGGTSMNFNILRRPHGPPSSSERRDRGRCSVR